MFRFVRAVCELHLIQNVVIVALIVQLSSSYFYFNLFFEVIFFDLIFFTSVFFIHFVVAQCVFCLASIAKLCFGSVFEIQLLLLRFSSRRVFVKEKIETNVSKFVVDQFSFFFFQCFSSSFICDISSTAFICHLFFCRTLFHV